MKVSIIVFCLLLAVAPAGIADTVYLKDGALVRGKITQEDANSIIIESTDTWRRVEKNSIELIRRDEIQSEETIKQSSGVEQPGEIKSQSPERGNDRERVKTHPSSWYFGVLVPFNMIGGDFDGQKAPDVNAGLGFGFVLGAHLSPNFALELDLAGSSHDSEGADVGFGEFSLNGKFWLAGTKEVRPFLFAGIGSFTLGDSSLTFGGTGYNLGLGTDFLVSPQTTIGVALIRKIITYDDVVESDMPVYLVGTLNGDTTSIRFDVTFHF